MKTIITTIGIAAFSIVSCKPVKTEASATDSVKPYTMDTCLVSGEKLGSMDEPVVMVYEGQEIKFCCKSCQPKFEKDPAKYLSKMK